MLRRVHAHFHLLLLAPRSSSLLGKRFPLQQWQRTVVVEGVVRPNIPERTPAMEAIIEAAKVCGVSPINMESVLDANPHLISIGPKHWTCVLKLLLGYGFKVEQVLSMTSQCSQILQLKEDKLMEKLEAWHNCHFGEDLLLPLLCYHPKLITAEKIDIIKRVTMLTPYLEGRKRVGKAIIIAPSIFYDNWESLFKKFQYLNTLHVDQSDIVSTGVLRFDLKHIKTRYEFLKRAGLFKMPTKNYKKSLDRNPKLHSIVNTSDQVFSTSIAGLSLLEYEVFKDIYDVEIKDLENNVGCSDTDTDSE